jgi:hypothetical protein
MLRDIPLNNLRLKRFVISSFSVPLNEVKRGSINYYYFQIVSVTSRAQVGMVIPL